MSMNIESCNWCDWQFMWEQGGGRYCRGPQTIWHEWSDDLLYEHTEQRGWLVKQDFYCFNNRIPREDRPMGCKHWKVNMRKVKLEGHYLDGTPYKETK